MSENEIATIVLDCAIRVHSALGPGLLESVYEACLKYELELRGVKVESQKALPVIYHGVQIDCGFRTDLLIEGKFVVELKAVESLSDIHLAQIITYLKLSNCKLGFLLNFNVLRMKDGGVKRVANGI